MPSQLGTYLQKYGDVTPDTTVVAGGTGDFAVITGNGTDRYAIYKIHLLNEGTAYKQFIIRDANGGTALFRMGVLNDTTGLTIDFPPDAPLIVQGIYADAVSGTDQCYVSVIAKKLTAGY